VVFKLFSGRGSSSPFDVGDRTNLKPGAFSRSRLPTRLRW
jgi:hypothetical protein